MRGDGAPAPRPITLRGLPDLAWRTLADDRASYVRSRRPGAAGALRSVWPSLRAPLFVVGAPRSGTTFLGRCIAALPEVSYHFEPVATKAAARYVHDGLWSPRRARRFYRTVYRWLLRVHLDGGRRFAEKTPRNCFILGFLADAFPGARFLYIVRDGRDAALSLSKKPWLRADAAGSGRFEPGGYPYGPYPAFWVEPVRREEFRATTDLHRCIWAWRRHNEAVLEEAPALPPGSLLEVGYERFVGDPRAGSARILDFLDITAANSRAAFLSAALGAAGDSVGGWRTEVAPAELAMMEAEAGPLLRRFGYAAPARRGTV